MKSARQNVILDVIASKNIETQNQLMEELKKIGVNSTQATLSRDIKDLQLIKELAANGKYRYVGKQKSNIQNHLVRLKAIFKESVSTYVSAQNLIVIKTLPGLAPAVCSAIDALSNPKIAGTIAGDDTAFVALFDTDAAENFCKDIARMLL